MNLDDSIQGGRAACTASPELDSLVPPTRLDRRGFLAGSAAAGFAVSVAPTGDLLAQTITTPATGLRAGDVLIPTRDGKSMPGYFAAPANASGAPTIVVIQEIFGVHEHIKDVCRRFAREGWLAIAPELYFRFGDPQAFPSIAQIQSDLVPKVTDAQVMADIDSTVAYAHVNGGDRDRNDRNRNSGGSTAARATRAVSGSIGWVNSRSSHSPSPSTPRGNDRAS
jgi:carboxymethylenebutenolidase